MSSPSHSTQPFPALKKEYWCFISYRHANNTEPGRQWATWLHQFLETYEVPQDLVGTTNDRGLVIPDRIFPVFRDEVDLPTDSDLAKPIEQALQRSRCLLVLCSPEAVASSYVASEILRFKQMGKGDRILAAILSGEPNASEDPAKGDLTAECFPKPLRYELGTDQELSPIRTEPIAANFRLPDGSEGWTTPAAYRESMETARIPEKEIETRLADYAAHQRLMQLKVVAGILGVDLDSLTKRDLKHQLEKQRARARALRRWLSLVAAVGAIALFAGLVAVRKAQDARAQEIAAERQRDIANIGRAARLISLRETTQAHSILNTTTAERRLWEWQHLQRRLDARDAIFKLNEMPGHVGAVLLLQSIHQNPQRNVIPLPDGKMGIKLMPWEQPFPLPVTPHLHATVHLDPSLNFAVVRGETGAWIIPVRSNWLKLLQDLWPEQSEELAKETTNRPVGQLVRLSKPVSEVCFGGREQLYLLNDDGTFELWRFDHTKSEGWSLHRSVQCPEGYHRAACSPNGKHLVIATKPLARSSGIELRRVHPETLAMQEPQSVDDTLSTDCHALTVGNDGLIMLSRTTAELWNGRSVGGTLSLEQFPLPDSAADSSATYLLRDPEHTFSSLVLPAELSYQSESAEQDVSSDPPEEKTAWATVAEWEGGQALLFSSGLRAHRLEGFGPSGCIGTLAIPDCLYTLHEDGFVGEWLISGHMQFDSAAPVTNEPETEGEESTRPTDFQVASEGQFFPLYDSFDGSYSRDTGVFSLPGPCVLYAHSDEDSFKSLRIIDCSSGAARVHALENSDYDEGDRVSALNSESGEVCAAAVSGENLYVLFLRTSRQRFDSPGIELDHHQECLIGAWHLSTGAWLGAYRLHSEQERNLTLPFSQPLTFNLLEPETEVTRLRQMQPTRLTFIFKPHDLSTPAFSDMDPLEQDFSSPITFSVRSENNTRVLSPDRMRVAALQGRRLTIRDSANDEVLLEYPLSNEVGNPYEVAWSGDGSLIAVGLGSSDPPRIGCMIWDGQNRAEVELETFQLSEHMDAVESAQQDPPPSSSIDSNMRVQTSSPPTVLVPPQK